MADLSLLAAVALSGYIVGDVTGPVRRSVTTALSAMEKAVNQDVNAEDCKE